MSHPESHPFSSLGFPEGEGTSIPAVIFGIPTGHPQQPWEVGRECPFAGGEAEVQQSVPAAEMCKATEGRKRAGKMVPVHWPQRNAHPPAPGTLPWVPQADAPAGLRQEFPPGKSLLLRRPRPK